MPDMNIFYDPLTGKICDRDTGQQIYGNIRIDDREYSPAEYAWFYMRGIRPRRKLRHINGDPTDVSWDNLEYPKYAANIPLPPNRVAARLQDLDRARNLGGYRGIARKIGVSHMTVYRAMSGGGASMATLVRLGELFGDVDMWLQLNMEDEKEKILKKKKAP